MKLLLYANGQLHMKIVYWLIFNCSLEDIIPQWDKIKIIYVCWSDSGGITQFFLILQHYIKYLPRQKSDTILACILEGHRSWFLSIPVINYVWNKDGSNKVNPMADHSWYIYTLVYL